MFFKAFGFIIQLNSKSTEKRRHL